MDMEYQAFHQESKKSIGEIIWSNASNIAGIFAASSVGLGVIFEIGYFSTFGIKWFSMSGPSDFIKSTAISLPITLITTTAIVLISRNNSVKRENALLKIDSIETASVLRRNNYIFWRNAQVFFWVLSFAFFFFAGRPQEYLIIMMAAQAPLLMITANFLNRSRSIGGTWTDNYTIVSTLIFSLTGAFTEGWKQGYNDRLHTTPYSIIHIKESETLRNIKIVRILEKGILARDENLIYWIPHDKVNRILEESPPPQGKSISCRWLNVCQISR